MIHYHGTPITPRWRLESIQPNHFCVSFADGRDLDWCVRYGQSVMMDNGAFSAFTRGAALDIPGFYDWIEPKLAHPHWAVVPDSIDGGVEEQQRLEQTWPFARAFGAPVYHLHEPLDRLLALTDTWPRVCIGSSGEFWDTRSDAWRRRIDQCWEAMGGASTTWVHMLRAMDEASKGGWPFASADSTNVARNAARDDVVAKTLRLNRQNGARE